MRLRLPLQSGSSVLPLLLLGVACSGAGLVAVVMALVMVTVPGEGVGFVFVPLLAALVFGACGVMVLRRAYQRRASDLVIADGTFQIEGGPHDGFSFTPADIDPYACRTFELADEYKENGRGDRIHTRVLRVSLRGGDDLDLAQSWEEDERASLASIAATISAMAPGATAPAVAAGPPDVVRCGACGAPLPAADVERVQCPYCGVPGQLPEALRDRVRDALTFAAHRRDTARAIEALLAQPSAHRMNVALVVTIGLALTAVPVGWALGPLVAIGALILAATVTFAMIAERRAYRVVSCDLAASGDGHERRCRLCQAPLPAVSEVLVRCMYCGADNLVAYDLRRPLEEVTTAPTDIDAVLARRARARLQHAVVAAFAVVWMMAGVALKAFG